MDISSAAYDLLSPTDLDNFINPLRLPGDDGVMGILDASDTPLRITTGTESVEVLPGKRSEISAYRVERDGKTYVNPTIRVRSGAGFSAELANGLDEETTIHWHGLHVDWRMDGHPRLPVAPDATYRYAYPVENRGGTYWYHPHAHGTTARQTYSGLAGFFLVEDEDERKLGEALELELGETDVPLLIQDKMFDEGGNFLYAPEPRDEEMGYEGDVILTNLTPNPYLEVGTRIYRFRILNGSNARNLRLAFPRAGEDELLPYHVVATDGVHQPPDTAVPAPPHHDAPRADDLRHRGQPQPVARDKPGGALLRHTLRPHPTLALLPQPERNGSPSQPPPDHRGGNGGGDADSVPERVPALPHVLRLSPRPALLCSLFTLVPRSRVLGSPYLRSCIAPPRSGGTAPLPAGSSPQNRGSKVHKWSTADPWR